MTAEFGEKWRQEFYDAICDSLELDEEADTDSRDSLHLLLLQESDRSIALFDDLRGKLGGKQVVVFGAGPSLESDILGLKDSLSRDKLVVVAADGAADALKESHYRADIIVSDLDSCSPETLIETSLVGVVFAHAHGDNKNLVRTIVPRLGKNKIGTTQVQTKEPVFNFGGFTDGDRACFIVSHFRPSRVIIAGMDFGAEEGRFSSDRYSKAWNSKRPLKLDWGKRSLEFLIRNSTKIEFVNVTAKGHEIRGAPKARYDEI